MANSTHADVVSLTQWKEKAEDTKFKTYLKLLSDHELVDESKTLSTDLQEQSLSKDLLKKSKLVLGEFADRLEKEASELSHEIRKMQLEIEH